MGVEACGGDNERELHTDREKTTQLDFVLDFYNTLYGDAGIKHHTPIRHIKSNDEVRKIVHNIGAISIKLDCLFQVLTMTILVRSNLTK